MPLPPLIQTGLGTLLSDIIIADSSKAISILKEHFRADEITKGYQDSYGYAITAITLGLATPDQKIAFTQKILHSKITRDFAEPIEINYLQQLAQQRGDDLSSLRQQLNQLIKYKDQLFQLKQITQADLAALLNYQSTKPLTQSVLAQLQSLTKVDETLAAFLSQNDLLGKAILYFFHELIRKDEHAAKIQAALQREGLTLSEQNLETALKTAQDNLNQAFASQSTQIVEIAQLQHLQQARSAWQTRNQLLSEITTQFSAWRELLNHQLEQLLNGVAQLFEKKEQVHNDIKNIKSIIRHLVNQLEKTINRNPNRSKNIQDKSWTEHQFDKPARYQTEDLNNNINLEMVYIPAGTFRMGSPENEKSRSSDENPQHQVTIKPFYMSKYPITQAQWQTLMGNNPSRFKGKNRPVERVSWHEAVAFCQRLSKKTGKKYSLPSEAQWEYACRAGTTTPFDFGETITTDLANYDANSTSDVGNFPPNAFGLYDMHGNVWEWCADPWHDNYQGAPNDGRVWEKGFFAKLFREKRVLRGGSWFNVPWSTYSAIRNRNSSIVRYAIFGFRVVSSVDSPKTTRINYQQR
ncbi:MAG: SUMF1/EgtB/PvdO family nonheme iron enzyme [Pseudomonadota bacterium]